MTSNIKMKYIERPELVRLLYIKGLTDTQILKTFAPNIDNEINRKTGKKISRDEIKLTINSIKKYVRISLENNGTNIIDYEYKNNNIERAYAKGLSLQRIRAEVRDFLSQNVYYDFDMSNAGPTIIKYLCKENNIMTPTLDLYVEDREAFIKKYCPNMDKHSMLIQGFFAKRSRSENPDAVKNIYKEVGKLKKALFTGDTNQYSSKLSKLFHHHENILLMKAADIIGHDNVGALIYDGLLVSKKVNAKELLEQINNSEEYKKYGMKMKVKEPWFNHEVDFSQIGNVTDDNSYEKVKERFEENNLKINIPVNYIEEYNDPKTGERKYHVHSDIGKRYEDLHYIDEDGSPQLFIPRWYRDPEKRVYKEIAFAPYSDPDKVNPQIFNTFRGYKAVLQNDFEEPTWFIKHIKHLCNNECWEFLLNYITHLIQKPEEIPRVGIVMKGMQGAGKDALIDTLSEIIGHTYVHRTSAMSSAFGNFTRSLKTSLIYQFNEVEGKHGFENAQLIKDMITRKQHSINEKHKEEYDVDNCSRCFFFSNVLTPLDIPPDDRRFVVYKTADKHSQEYYDNYYSFVESEEEINNLFTYLMNRDISNFKPWKEQQNQKTHNYKIMREFSIPTIYYFLRQYKLANYKYNTNSILAHNMFKDFLEFCNNRHIRSENLQYKTILKMCYELKGIDFNRSNAGVEMIFTKDFLPYLNKKYFDEVMSKDLGFLDSDSEEEIDEVPQKKIVIKKKIKKQKSATKPFDLDC